MIPQLLWAAMLMTNDTDVTDRDLRAALLDRAREPVVEALGKPVLFRVHNLRRQGDWAFLFADMEDSGGRPVDYAGTPKEEAARHGLASRGYAALMRRNGDEWTVVAHAIGPTDLAWEGWSSRYGAPPELFKLQ